MVTRAQKEEIANHIKEAIAVFLRDDKFINTLVDRVSASLKSVLDQNKAIIEELDNKVQAVTKENDSLNRRIKFLEKSLVKCTVRINGMENVEGDGNTEARVNNLFNNVLKLNIKPSAIADVYTFNYKNDSKKSKQKGDKEIDEVKSTVVVRFTSHKDRQSVLRSRKQLKSTGIKIYEELSRDTLSLYKKAVKKYSDRNVWTFGDKVFIKDGDVKKKLNSEELND